MAHSCPATIRLSGSDAADVPPTPHRDSLFPRSDRCLRGSDFHPQRLNGMTRSFVRALLVALTLFPVAGCSDLFGPGGSTVEDGDLTIISVAADAPPLTATEVSFWAVKGQDREVQIQYRYPNGSLAKCLRFVVPADALLRKPDRTLVARGDSVQITIKVVDPQLFLFEFSPRLLQFDRDDPARLEIRYQWTSADLDGDGDVDADDAAIRSRFGLWRQERLGEGWQEVPSTRDENSNELHADITGFTRYALAAD